MNKKRLTKNQLTLKGWNIRLKVSPEEERKIKKEAIDNDMRVAEYIKQVLLDRLSASQNPTQGKSA